MKERKQYLYLAQETLVEKKIKLRLVSVQKIHILKRKSYLNLPIYSQYDYNKNIQLN
jgi:transposase